MLKLLPSVFYHIKTVPISVCEAPVQLEARFTFEQISIGRYCIKNIQQIENLLLKHLAYLSFLSTLLQLVQHMPSRES